MFQVTLSGVSFGIISNCNTVTLTFGSITSCLDNTTLNIIAINNIPGAFLSRLISSSLTSADFYYSSFKSRLDHSVTAVRLLGPTMKQRPTVDFERRSKVKQQLGDNCSAYCTRYFEMFISELTFFFSWNVVKIWEMKTAI